MSAILFLTALLLLAQPSSAGPTVAIAHSRAAFVPLVAVEQCRAELAGHANPIFYGTQAAVEDLDAIRAASVPGAPASDE